MHYMGMWRTFISIRHIYYLWFEPLVLQHVQLIVILCAVASWELLLRIPRLDVGLNSRACSPANKTVFVGGLEKTLFTFPVDFP